MTEELTGLLTLNGPANIFEGIYSRFRKGKQYAKRWQRNVNTWESTWTADWT